MRGRIGEHAVRGTRAARGIGEPANSGGWWRSPSSATLALLVAVGIIAPACGEGPPRPPCGSGGGPIATICGFENPEDIEYVANADLLVASNMRFDGRDQPDAIRGGYLSGLALATGTTHRMWPDVTDESAPQPALGDPVCLNPPSSGVLYPHGITSVTRDGRPLLYAIGHQGEAGGREAVEIFEIVGRGETARLKWRACVPMRPHVMGNDIAIAPDGEIVVSNYQPSVSLWHVIKANVLRMSTGDIQAWSRDRGWRTIPGTAASLPNGVAISADGLFVYYSELGTGRAYRIARDGTGERLSVDIGGNPDDFAWSGRGTLLLATHTGGIGLLACAFGRSPCRTSWELYEIDPTSMAAQRLLAGDGGVLGAMSTPAVIGPMLYLASIYDDRIGVLPLPAR